MSNSPYTIGIVSLSTPTVGRIKERVEMALQYFDNQDVPYVLSQTASSKEGKRSASIQDRVQDLEQMFVNPNIDIILNVTGGYNSNELLEYLDYDLIAKNPKPFVGYSDITTLNMALYTKSNIPTINGPMLIDSNSDSEWYIKIVEALNNPSSLFPAQQEVWVKKEDPVFSSIIKALPGKQSTATGGAIAGNLSTFNLLLGTPYLPDLNGKILFLEYDKEEQNGLISLQRMLWQIRQNGLFEQINGLILGVLEPAVAAEEESNYDRQMIYTEVTDGYSFPVLFDVPFGHIYPSWIIPNGQQVSIDGTSVSAVY